MNRGGLGGGGGGGAGGDIFVFVLTKKYIKLSK